MVFSLEIGDRRVLNDGSSFADYIYDLHIHFDNADTVVERSYLDFCDLDSHIQSEVHHSVDLPECPLLGSAAIRKQHSKSNDPFGAIRRATIGGDGTIEYEPIFTDDRLSYLVSTYGVEEDVDAIPLDLTTWMKQLVMEPSVLQLTAMAKFLNKEEKSFRKNSEGIDRELTEYDYLVPKKNMKSKQLMSKFSIPVEVQMGDILVWRFKSKSSDVAYSIEINGDHVLPVRRYASSKEEVLGVMQVPTMIGGKEWNGRVVCEMKFENKYAGMLAATTLSYACRVVESLEFNDSRRRAHEGNLLIRKKVLGFATMKESLLAEAAEIKEKGMSVRGREQGSNGEGRSNAPSGSGNRFFNAAAAVLGNHSASSNSPQTASGNLVEENSTLRREIASLKREVQSLRDLNDSLKLKLLRANRRGGLAGVDESYEEGEFDCEDRSAAAFPDGDDTSSDEGEPSQSRGNQSPLKRLSQKVSDRVMNSSPSAALKRLGSSGEQCNDSVPNWANSEEDFDNWYLQQFGESASMSREGNSKAIGKGLKTFARRVSTIFKYQDDNSSPTSSSHGTPRKRLSVGGVSFGGTGTGTDDGDNSESSSSCDDRSSASGEDAGDIDGMDRSQSAESPTSQDELSGNVTEENTTTTVAVGSDETIKESVDHEETNESSEENRGDIVPCDAHEVLSQEGEKVGAPADADRVLETAGEEAAERLLPDESSMDEVEERKRSDSYTKREEAYESQTLDRMQALRIKILGITAHDRPGPDTPTARESDLSLGSNKKPMGGDILIPSETMEIGVEGKNSSPSCSNNNSDDNGKKDAAGSHLSTSADDEDGKNSDNGAPAGESDVKEEEGVAKDEMKVRTARARSVDSDDELSD